MGLTRLCLKNPAAAGVVLALITLLGALSVSRLPVQLFPAIERPEISIHTVWRAASPREIESEITEPIERELRGIQGVTQMQSWSNQGDVWMQLQFALGTDMNAAFTEVNARLQRVRGLPAEAERPRVQLGGGNNSGETLIFLFLQRLPGSQHADVQLSTFAEQRIAPLIEAAPGVAGVDVNSDDGEMIVRIEFDPFLAAQLGITIDDIAQNINRSTDVTGGSVEVGRRNYTLRFEGRFDADQLNNTILAWRDGAPVLLGDIAMAEITPDYRGGVVYQNGNPAIGMRVLREPGANTLEAIDSLTEVVNELNAGPLAEMGYAVHKSFDPSVFIKRAISLLTNNLMLGIILAVGALWLFLRRTAATFLIASAIPICLMATMIVLNLAGRTINVISLAGLAFAVGMVLDAAIVVLENFVRMREEGRSPFKAAEAAVAQVFGALFASTVTTVAIFIPIMFFEDVEGQLFADLALTIAIAVSFSLVAAVTLLPAGAKLFIKDAGDTGAAAAAAKRGSKFAENLADRIMALTASGPRRIAIVLGLTLAPIALTFLLWPPLNYLPPVKRDAVDANISFPSGASADMVRREFAEVVVERLQPYMDGEKEPALRNYYLYTGEWGGNTGIRINDQSRIDEMVAIVNEEILAGFPDTRIFAQQGNLFGNWGGAGSIRMELQSGDFDALGDATPDAIDIIRNTMPGAQVWPNPDPQIVRPELRLLPNDRRIAEVGMTREQVARAVRVLGDGEWLGEFFHEDGRLDIYLRAREWTAPEYLETAPIATPTGSVAPLGEFVTIERGVGPQQIYRLDGRRTISLGVTPPDGVALGPAVDTLKRNAERRIYDVLPPGSTIKWSGDADSLARAVQNLGGNFLLAIVILFLILAALFKSIKDAGLVIITLPMATVGGVLAIQAVNLFKDLPLDLLGMIGFIILLGLVVNNAILLVAQTRASEAKGLDRSAAVREALTLRIRPIFMSTTTSLMGMLPLVLSPGAGSLIYRGLATVIVGGMAVSMAFTLLLLPALLQLGAKPAHAGAGQPALQPAE